MSGQPGQTQIPHTSVPSTIGPCAWCETPTSQRITLTKARWGTAANGARELRKPALTEWCCDTHLASLERRPGMEDT